MAEAMATTQGYGIRHLKCPTAKPELRAFVLGDERQCVNMVLALVRVVPVAARSYMVLFSDGVSCVWTIAYENTSIVQELQERGADIIDMVEYEVMLTKCASADGPPFVMCRFIRQCVAAATDKDEGGGATLQSSGMSHSLAGMNRRLHEHLQDSTIAGGKEKESFRVKKKPVPVMMELLVCRGPRRVLAGGAIHKELRMSSVDNVIADVYGRELFFARLCVLGFYQRSAGALERVVLTDGTHTVLVRSSEMPDVYKHNIVDVEGCWQAKGRADGLLEATVHHYTTHNGADLTCCVMQSLKKADTTTPVARWECVGTKLPKMGCLVESAAITSAVAAKQSFDLVEYHVLQMTQVRVMDYVLVEGSYIQAFQMPAPVPNTRSQGRHAVAAAQCSTTAQLGHALHRIMEVMEVFDYIYHHFLLVAESARLSQVNKMLRQIALRVACNGRTQFYMLAPPLFKRMERVFRLEHQVSQMLFDSTLANALDIPYESAPAEFSLVTRIFQTFETNNLKQCVCGDSAACLFCLSRLDRHRSKHSHFTVAALSIERPDPQPKMSTLRDLERLRLRHMNVLRFFDRQWKVAHHLQAFVAEQTHHVRMYVLTDSPEVTMEETNAHARRTDEWLLLRLRTHKESQEHEHLAEPEVLGPFDQVAWWENRLVGLHSAQPLVPGSIELLYEDSIAECVRGMKAWKNSPVRLSHEYGPQDCVPVPLFCPPSETLPMSRRMRVQLHSALFFKSRVVYFGTEDGPAGATMHKDSVHYTFVAHDGENVMLFTTDCESFVDMLEHAVTTRELDNNFSRNIMHGHDDPHMQNIELKSCSVLENYVVEMTVLAVHDTAILSGSDAEDGKRMFIFQWLCRDFRVLDSQHALIQATAGHLLADALFQTINAYVEQLLEDEDEDERLDSMLESDADIEHYSDDSEDSDNEDA